MDERPPWDGPTEDEGAERNPRDNPEGVRIIGAEEAAKAQERGDVAARRGEGLPRYGDRPESPPDDARPALRFPLGDADPAGVARPRVSGSSSLPPWTDPPTGEVPRLLDPGEDATGDDLDAWSSFAAAGPRWRGEGGDWDEPDYEEGAMAHDEGTRVGALDESDRPGPDDFFTFGDEPAPAPPQPTVVRTGMRVPRGAPPSHGPAPSGPLAGEPHRSDRDVRTAVATGLGFAAAALVLFALGPGPAMVLVTGVIVVAAAELFGALQRGGYQPATLLGLVATGALVTGAYWKGETALPLVMGLTVVFAMLWFLLGVTRAAPTLNLAASVLGVAYVGLLGSFAALILKFPNGTGVLMGVVIVVVANDVGALAVGRRWGRAPLAAEISPAKTVEGLLGGALASVVVGVAVLAGPFGMHPWDFGSALGIAAVVAVAAPLGDLCESMIKRDLGLKDMSTVLPGHGGVLDRFDAMLFALPAAYYFCRLIELF